MPGTVLRSRIFPAWKSWMLVLALAVLRPGPALAQGSTDVQAYLLSVKRLYEDLENESALKQIASAKMLPRTKNEDVTLSLYEGVILADLSQWEKSAAAFKAALSQHPEAQLPVKAAPKVQQHFEKVRQQVKQELMGHAKPPSPPAKTPKPEVGAPPAEPAPKKPELIPSKPSSSAPLHESPTVTGRSTTKPRILLPAIASGALLAAGGASWALSRRELSRLNGDDPSLATRGDAQSAASRGRTLQSVGVVLLGAGIVGVGFTAGRYVLGGESNELSLAVGTGGTSAFVQGKWP